MEERVSGKRKRESNDEKKIIKIDKVQRLYCLPCARQTSITVSFVIRELKIVKLLATLPE